MERRMIDHDEEQMRLPIIAAGTLHDSAFGTGLSCRPAPRTETAMTETEFNAAVDATLLAIEDAVDDLEQDVDMENSGGILTLTCPNGSKVIINRQGPTREIWVAARSGGFHCGRMGDDWVCNTTHETLPALLSRVLTEQTGEMVSLPF